MAKNDNGLTIKQQKFADLIREGKLTQAECYRNAGYSGNDDTCRVEASKLLKNPNISAYIEKMQEEVREKTTVTVEYIVENAKRVLEKSMQDVPVMKFNYETKEMEETGEYQFDSKGANGALKILGDTIGAFKEKKEVEHIIPENSPLIDIMKQLTNKEESVDE